MAAVAAKPAMSSGMQMLYYVMADCRKESPWPRVGIPARKLLDIMVWPSCPRKTHILHIYNGAEQ